jgi:hypothetical protein
MGAKDDSLRSGETIEMLSRSLCGGAALLIAALGGTAHSASPKMAPGTSFVTIQNDDGVCVRHVFTGLIFRAWGGEPSKQAARAASAFAKPGALLEDRDIYLRANDVTDMPGLINYLRKPHGDAVILVMYLPLDRKNEPIQNSEDLSIDQVPEFGGRDGCPTPDRG